MNAKNEELSRLEKELVDIRQRIAEVRRGLPAETVGDYTFKGPEGISVTLTECFGDKNELILIHNMGKKCPYCTLWADGFIGFTKHLEDRAAFVVTSPDDPETQRRFALDRGWNFKLYSTQGTTFKKDMGFEPEPGSYWPGVSIFKKDESGAIYHVTKAEFGPGDDYCAIWRLFELLPSKTDWEPKYHYGR